MDPKTASGPALRAFFQIAARWKLGTEEQMALLGLSARSTFFKWKKDQGGRLPLDTLERISYLIGIFKALHVLLPDEEAADAWIKQPNAAPLCGDRSALERMLCGRVGDLYVVRQYLDAQRGGLGVSIPVHRVRWEPCWRLIPTRSPAQRILDMIAAPGELEAVAALDRMTSERQRQESDELAAVDPRDCVSGPGSEYIMAPFLYRNPEGSRFSDGGHGVYYTALSLPTAVAQTKDHRERFLRRTGAPPMSLEMRALAASLDARLHDLRGMQASLPQVYAAEDPATAQALARKLIPEGADGIVYDDVWHDGGACAAVFKPAALSDCRAEKTLVFDWDGARIARVRELR